MNLYCQGSARHGEAWRGEARHGVARRGSAWHGEARRGEARHGYNFPIREGERLE